jgi:YHS domain-containing protein
VWVDDGICDFLDTYLRIEQGDGYTQESAITDPVCGMQIVKPLAAARTEYQGKTYYFCVEECRRKFEADPERYIQPEAK